jgi:hypothetical protein
MTKKIKRIIKIVLYILLLIIGTGPLVIIAFILGGIDTVAGAGFYDSLVRLLEKIKYWFINDRWPYTPVDVQCIDCRECRKDNKTYWCSLENCIVDPLEKEECPSFRPAAKKSWRKK